MKSIRIGLISIVASMAILSGCATNSSSDSGRYTTNGVQVVGSTKGVPVVSNLNLLPLEYSYNSAVGQIVELQYGKVIVQSDPSLLAIGGGAVVGGVLGNQVGKGNGRKAATVLGALIGGGVGSALSTSGGERYVDIYKMTVRLKNGQHFKVLQADRGENFNKGEYVQSYINSRGYWEVRR